MDDRSREAKIDGWKLEIFKGYHECAEKRNGKNDKNEIRTQAKPWKRRWPRWRVLNRSWRANRQILEILNNYTISEIKMF